jgi:hypothetical protein
MLYCKSKTGMPASVLCHATPPNKRKWKVSSISKSVMSMKEESMRIHSYSRRGRARTFCAPFAQVCDDQTFLNGHKSRTVQ